MPAGCRFGCLAEADTQPRGRPNHRRSAPPQSRCATSSSFLRLPVAPPPSSPPFRPMAPSRRAARLTEVESRPLGGCRAHRQASSAKSPAAPQGRGRGHAWAVDLTLAELPACPEVERHPLPACPRWERICGRRDRGQPLCCGSARCALTSLPIIGVDHAVEFQPVIVRIPRKNTERHQHEELAEGAELLQPLGLRYRGKMSARSSKRTLASSAPGQTSRQRSVRWAPRGRGDEEEREPRHHAGSANWIANGAKPRGQRRREAGPGIALDAAPAASTELTVARPRRARRTRGSGRC